MTNAAKELKPYKYSRFHLLLTSLAISCWVGVAVLGFTLDATDNLLNWNWNLIVVLTGTLSCSIIAFVEWEHVLETPDDDDVSKPTKTKAWALTAISLVQLCGLIFWIVIH